uniref:Uncharacterized protein MANES_06G113300 n=1 Tax=Rhizophora mucronata TaxID=61149 RepID=A0A2P2JRX8_RHIMU
MTEGRRHSVDIPISRTLIALRRVRSLRDPSTNSMSKFSALLENANWETNSANEISLQFTNGWQGGNSDCKGLSGLKQLNGPRREQADDFKLQCDLGKQNCRLVSCENSGKADDIADPVRTGRAEGLDISSLNQEDIHGNEPLKICYGNHMDQRLDEMCIHNAEIVDSTSEPIAESPQVDGLNQSVLRLKFRSQNKIKSCGMVGDVMSSVGSPCTSISDALSSRSVSLYAKEKNDFVGQNDCGCGISCCWARTPKFRGSNSCFDAEGHPLLSRDVADTTPHGQMSWKNTLNEIPRSLSQKYRPKFFDEMVGQDAVAKSLLCAISRGRITSLYLFHGPRGTGKTSASRIFAAALNCLLLRENKPCGLCRECVLFFSGRSKDVKEVDSVRINRPERIRSILKNATIPPVSARFRVFIVDECHLLHGETWATIVNSLDNLPQYVVFVIITPDLDKLPRSAVTRSQRYHFPKIKDGNIATRLRNICVEERLDFDQAALDFIAAKSNGSLRDAEMMLEQLSLLGKRITISLAHELIGVVSDDELLDLLDLALSSDTSNTVIRARELMKSRIDPIQLVSQLANLIMDILAGNWNEDGSKVQRKFSRRHASDTDLQRLNHALKILSETEKQLRASKSQSIWLTVALLQLSNVEPSSLDSNDSKSPFRNAHDRDKDGHFCCTSFKQESIKHVVPCSCDYSKLCSKGMLGDAKETLESVWKRATELCQSNSLRNFLQKQGRLSSIHFDKDFAVAELEFHHPDCASKAEKSWKMIASSLQSILGCNIEVRINLVLCSPMSKCAMLRKLSFGLFSCSRRMQPKSQSPAECISDSEYSDHVSEKPMIKNQAVSNCPSGCGSHMPHRCYPREESMNSLRDSEGNVLCIKKTLSHRSLQDTSTTPGCVADCSNGKGNNPQFETFCSDDVKDQSHCFPRALRPQRKSRSSDVSQVICIV